MVAWASADSTLDDPAIESVTTDFPGIARRLFLNKEYSKIEGLRLEGEECLLSQTAPSVLSPHPSPSGNRSLKERLPDWVFAVLEWRKIHGALPNILRPGTFNEKILYRILFDRRPILTKFADKAAVRGYVEERLGPDLLPKLHHLTGDPETIPFDDLPDRFVVKPTHGSGWVQLVPDKSALDRDALMRTCRDWLSQSFYRKTREWAYKNITPRIMVEEYIDDGSSAEPSDYKLFVFDGVVEFIHIDVDRFSNHRRRLFTPAWQEMDVSFGEARNVAGKVPPPAHLAAMIRAAEILGRDVDFVRADFYDTGDRLYFSELTMTPGCGHNRFRPRVFDHYLGGRWRQRIK